MTVLGIITCEILELEFARLLGEDQDIGEITVIEDICSQRLIENLEKNEKINIRKIPYIKGFIPSSNENFDVLVKVLEMGIHRNRRFMRETLNSTAHEMRPCMDALLLGYGLCGSALANPDEILDLDIPVFIPMDGDHPVDDCVGLLLGGREVYYGEQLRVPGTFFMPPGWTYHWKKILGKDLTDSHPDIIKRIFKGYKRALMVESPVMSQKEMLNNMEEFIKITGFRVEKVQGTLKIPEETWKRAKEILLRKKICGEE